MNPDLNCHIHLPAGWRKNQTWSPTQQADKSKKQLRNLKNVWLETTAAIGGLKGLPELIRKCGSDDESDEEALPTQITLKYPQEFCKTQKLPWQSSQLEEAFVLLDMHREQTLNAAVMGEEPQIECINDLFTTNPINPPKGLPKDFYNSDWLEEQDEKVVNALEIPAAPPAALPPILKCLSEVVTI
ncbi:hypothetical protein PCASD_15459 [Puccinia coronata f. sp. avenae]|uniref:Uncharacterized protein n=1 Tax=Puccinia coronata f. sp. avenae TaxID=200324 RepID=A0A2N5UPW3_9BASI|nr:hypothetical protein PCASD_15459 [Puccinia coronata f. sp. avenae]